MDDMIKVTNDSGVEFIVRALREGDKYGRNGGLTYTSKHSVVELFDPSYTFTYGEFGEFVSRFSVSDFLNLPINEIYLGSSSSDTWYLSAENISEIKDWLVEYSLTIN